MKVLVSVFAVILASSVSHAASFVCKGSTQAVSVTLTGDLKSSTELSGAQSNETIYGHPLVHIWPRMVADKIPASSMEIDGFNRFSGGITMPVTNGEPVQLWLPQNVGLTPNFRAFHRKIGRLPYPAIPLNCEFTAAQGTQMQPAQSQCLERAVNTVLSHLTGDTHLVRDAKTNLINEIVNVETEDHVDLSYLVNYSGVEFISFKGVKGAYLDIWAYAGQGCKIIDVKTFGSIGVRN